LDGRLIEVLKARTNADLGVADCYGGWDTEPYCANDFQKSFYPCKDKLTTKKKPRKTTRKKSTGPLLRRLDNRRRFFLTSHS
jgi:hypothetical protein